MNTDTVKLQFTIPRVLSVALRAAASEDLRTQQAFLIILLQECPAIKLFIPKSPETNAKYVEADVEAPVEDVTLPLPVRAYTDEERGAAAAAWRPGQ